MTSTTTELARLALAVNDANLALGHQVFEAAGATFVRDPAFATIHDANHVTRVTASMPDEIDRLMARVEIEYGSEPFRKFHTDFTTPPAFEARLALDGYERRDTLVMLLEGALRADVKTHRVRPIVDDAGWAAFHALQLANWDEQVARLHISEPPDVPLALAETRRRKSPAVHYFVAYAGRRPCGYFSSWAGIDGMGQVEDLFVHPCYRHRGIATALVARCVEDCRAQGCGPVVIVCDPTDTPKQMYAAIGFRPVAVKRDWLKRL